jgi:acetyl-CoA carboxylase, biotin carboxylase subunit
VLEPCASAQLFGKVLVANRGEIAVRIIRALRELGIGSVAVYSDADRASLAVQLADEAACIGPAAASQSYLHTPALLDAARRHKVDAIHPGYGFLSENADFAQACHDAGFVFIGPPASAIRSMGSKTAARQIAIAAGAPVVPGIENALTDLAQAQAAASELGYPVLVKAAAGGGGKGMRRVDHAADLEAALRDASSEAQRAFNDGDVYVEKLIVAPRHVEIQVLGDHYGHIIHLGERECSVQRRHQKVMEECPAPVMRQWPDLRRRMGEAAVKIARAAGYRNAGTVEFLVDSEGRFYFLEMNTRLQVEHPVTELVTGIDLVAWQLRIAAGHALTIQQADVGWTGSAIQCRVYAEDPDLNYLPSPGRIERLREPAGPGIRLDSGVYEGWTVPMEYDPLLAKLCAWSADRTLTCNRLLRALDEYTVLGVRTNLGLFRDILADPDFRAGHITTAFLDEFAKRRPMPVDDPIAEAAAALVLSTLQTTQVAPAANTNTSRWLVQGRAGQLREATRHP